MPDRLTYVGHATTLIELGGARVLTDPVLRNRLAHLRRHGAAPDGGVSDGLDAVLVSHMHLDHLDVPSLKRIDPETEAIVPAGAGAMLKRIGFKRVREMAAGDEIGLKDLTITAVHAEHDSHRWPERFGGPVAEPLGFVVESGDRRIYFAGDTDLYPGMEDAIGATDVALLPVWGWGPTLGDGHMDPRTATEAAVRIAPRVAVPIHWGTFYPVGLGRVRSDRLTAPPLEFERYTGDAVPGVDVRVLDPGESTDL